jgi:hypothetical protein
MIKTITVFDWPGGGTWGLHQLVFAHFIEELSGLPIAELTDVNYGRSVGAVGATSSLIRDVDDVTKPKFTMGSIIQTFYEVANDIFGDTDIRDHQARAVEHDLRRFHEHEQKRRLFRDNTGNMHLDHSKLSAALEGCYNDTKFEDLLKSTVVLSQHFQSRVTYAHTHLDSGLFDANKWSVMQNLGNQTRVVDAVMCSTAAPTVFDSYSYDEGHNHYVDGAGSYGPTDLLLNLQKMHDGPVKFNVITLGTGNVSCSKRDPREYSDSGFLRMGQGLNDSINYEMMHRDYERMKAMFDGVRHTTFDTDLSNVQKNGEKYEYTPFAGTVTDLDFIIETAVASARSQHDQMMQTIEDICETRIRETMPKISSTRVTEVFYSALRKRAPRLTPAKAVPFEEAILMSQATDIENEEVFSLEGILSMAKGDRKDFKNTTLIPPSALSRVVSKIPVVNKWLRSTPVPA